MAYYFIYGSNMDINQLEKRIHRRPEVQSALLKDFKLCFNKLSKCSGFDEGKGNIVPEKDCVVEGILFNLSEDEINLSHPHKGYPEDYVRKTLSEELKDKTVIDEYVYIAQPVKSRKD